MITLLVGRGWVDERPKATFFCNTFWKRTRSTRDGEKCGWWWGEVLGLSSLGMEQSLILVRLGDTITCPREVSGKFASRRETFLEDL
jgi:hypothetical protein